MSIPVIDIVKTGENIRNLRKLAGISITELQDIFGFRNPQAIYKWQRGEALPSIDNLVVLASVLNVRIDDILMTVDDDVSLSA